MHGSQGSVSVALCSAGAHACSVLQGLECKYRKRFGMEKSDVLLGSGRTVTYDITNVRGIANGGTGCRVNIECKLLRAVGNDSDKLSMLLLQGWRDVPGSMMATAAEGRQQTAQQLQQLLGAVSRTLSTSLASLQSTIQHTAQWFGDFVSSARFIRSKR